MWSNYWIADVWVFKKFFQDVGQGSLAHTSFAIDDRMLSSLIYCVNNLAYLFFCDQQRETIRLLELQE